MYPQISLLLFLYTLLSPYYPNPKQRSWILTAFGSAITTLGSVPYVWRVIKSGSVNIAIVGGEGWFGIEFAEWVCRFFGAYLIWWVPSRLTLHG